MKNDFSILRFVSYFIFILLIPNYNAIASHSALYENTHLSSVVTDNAGLFTHSQIQYLEKKINNFKLKRNIMIVVATTDHLPANALNLHEFSKSLFDNNGFELNHLRQVILMLVVKDTHQVRIEVEDLKFTITDGELRDIIQENMIPYFKSKDYYIGVLNAIDQIISDVEMKDYMLHPEYFMK